MKVRCWGARGSIPVSGNEFIKYGGDTCCIEIRTKNDEIIIIDAGSGIRRLGNKLIEEGRTEYTLLFTHSHWDHILGFPFFKPVHRPVTRMSIHSCRMPVEKVQALVAHTLEEPYFPVPYDQIAAEIKFIEPCTDTFRIDSVEVSTIPLSHPNEGQGFRFDEDGSSFVFLTDNELSFVNRGGLDVDHYVEFSRGANLLIHDAEYTRSEYQDRQGWGHSCYMDALEAAVKAQVGSFGLFHHNQDRTDSEIDSIVAECRRIADSRGVNLDCFGVTQDFEVTL